MLSDGATFRIEGVARGCLMGISEPYSIESSRAKNLCEAICFVFWFLTVRGAFSALFLRGLGRLSSGDFALDCLIPTLSPSIIVTYPSLLIGDTSDL